mgnify:CR=1 FL=1
MKTNWPVVVLIAPVVLVFLIAVGLSDGRMMPIGWGMMGPWMMGGWGFNPFGWISMAIVVLIPIGFLLALVLWVVRNLGKRNLPMITCPNCRRLVRADRYTCQYCGIRLL